MSVLPGWFRDPAGREDAYRWWDGRGWTQWLGADPDAAPPSPPDGPVPPMSTAADEPAPRAAATLPDGDQIRVPVAIALVVGVLIVALVVVGLTVVLTKDRIRTGPALPPPAAVAESDLTYAETTRTARVADVEMDLPGAPYTCKKLSQGVTALLRSAVSCDLLIHPKFDGKHDWYASSGFGVIERSLVRVDDDGATAEAVFSTARELFFSDVKTTVRNKGRLVDSALPTGRGAFIGGDVHYSAKGLPSTYDRLVVAVVPISNGDYVAFFSSRPDDTPKSALAVLNRAVATLRVR